MLRTLLRGANKTVVSPCRVVASALLRRRCHRRGCSVASKRCPPLSGLPPEVLAYILGQHRRGDLRDIANSAAAASTLYIHCKPLLQRVHACRQCDAPLYHPRCMLDARTTSLLASRPFASDGHATVLSKLPLIADGASFLHRVDVPSAELDGLCLDDLRLKRALARFVSKSHGEKYKETDLVLQRLVCRRCQLYLGECVATAQATADSAPFAAFICRGYTRELDDEGPCNEAPKPVYCSGARRLRGRGPCGQLLCDLRSVLSRQHCWSPPGGSTESAWYINGYVEGSVSVGTPRRQRLAQGPMEVADVSCTACLGVVGWQFVKDLDQWQANRNQVGRFGFCTSSIRREEIAVATPTSMRQASEAGDTTDDDTLPAPEEEHEMATRIAWDLAVTERLSDDELTDSSDISSLMESEAVEI